MHPYRCADGQRWRWENRAGHCRPGGGYVVEAVQVFFEVRREGEGLLGEHLLDLWKREVGTGRISMRSGGRAREVEEVGTYGKLRAKPDSLDVDLHELVECFDRFVLDTTAA